MSTTLTPYLSFAGKTREAFAFYEKALGAKIETMMSYADMPASATPQRRLRRCRYAQWRRHHACMPQAARRCNAVCRRHPARHAA